jgi:predicted aspartyl protease
MGRAWRKALWAPVLLVAASVSAAAQECTTLRQIMSIPITVKDSRILVPVTINGVQQTFLLDTGGAFTQVKPSLVREMDLRTEESNVKLLDLYGNASNRVTRVAFGLGGLQDRNAELQVSPQEFGGESYVGILAADYLGRYDVEIDLAGGKLNYFSPDHCPGKVVYWEASAIAVVPFQFRNRHFEVTATVNGREMKAILDTGAPYSVLRAEEAKRLFDVTADTPGNIDVYTLPNGGKEFLRAFQSLGLEGIAVSNPRILVMPDMVGTRDPNNDFVTGTRLRRVHDTDSSDPPLLIGMNVISRLRIYISFKEGLIYVTPPVRPAASAPAGN